MIAKAALFLVGLLLVAAGILVSSAAWEAALRGGAKGALGWGPALFRILLVVHGIGLMILGIRLRRRGLSRQESRPRPEGLSGTALAALVLLTAVAAVFRLHQLGSQLWLDEILTLVEVVRLPLGHIFSSFPSQNQHMLYSILARLSFDLFGESAWSLRLPAALFGVLSLWPLHALAARLSGARVALAACAVMTFSYHHIWFSQNARGYTGLLLFATLATWLWLEAGRRGGWNWWIAYALAVFFGMWVQLTMLFVVAAHGLIWLGSWLRQRRFPTRAGIRPVGAWLLAATLSLQVYAFSLPEFLRSAAGEVSMPSDWTDPLWLVRITIQNLAVVPGGVPAVLAAAAVLVLGWRSIWQRDAQAALVMVLPVVLCGITMIVLAHNLWPRFFFFAAGFALIFLLEGALRLAELAGRLAGARPVVTACLGWAALLVMVAGSAATSARAWALPKQDYLGAKAYVEQRRAPGDGVVTVGLAATAYRYYAPEWASASTVTALDELRRSHRRLWLIYTLPVQLQGFHPELWEAVQRDFRVVEVFPGTLAGGEVYVCRDRTPGVE